MRTRRHPQTGFTLFELAVGLVITGVVIGGLWVLSSNVSFNQNINQLEKGIITTVSRMRNFYRDRQIQNDNASLNNANLVALGLVAPEILQNGNIVHSLTTGAPGAPGNITINYDLAKCAVPNSFAMTLANLTQKACTTLTARLAGSRGQIKTNNIVGLFVGNANVLTATVQNNVTAYDFNPVLAAKTCADNIAVEICFAQ